LFFPLGSDLLITLDKESWGVALSAHGINPVFSCINISYEVYKHLHLAAGILPMETANDEQLAPESRKFVFEYFKDRKSDAVLS